MYIHYCQRCNRIHMLNGHKVNCPKCNTTLTELRIPYIDYVYMDGNDRIAFTKKCADPRQLSKLSTTYRMFKYSKWYKEQHSLTQWRSIFVIIYKLNIMTPARIKIVPIAFFLVIFSRKNSKDNNMTRI